MTSYAEYNSTNPLHIHRPFLGILPNDSIYKDIETSSLVPNFSFSQYAVMYFIRDRRTKQPDTELFNFSPRAPITTLLPLSEMDTVIALSVEKRIMMYMRDLPIEGNPALILDLITEAVTTNQAIADESFCFLMKQTTANMQQSSEKRGWELMCYLLSIVLPSRNLFAYVLWYIKSALFSNEIQVTKIVRIFDK